MKKKSAVKLFAGFLAASLLFSAVSPEEISLIVSATNETSGKVIVTVDGVTKGYDNIETAWSEAVSSNKAAEIELREDTETTGTLTLGGANITLKSDNDSTVKFTGNGQEPLIFADSGNLTINGGKYIGGKYSIQVGEYKSEEETYVQINGGEFSGTDSGLYVYDGWLMLCGGKFSGDKYAIYSNGPWLSELTGKTEDGKSYAYYNDSGEIITGILFDRSIVQTVTVKECEHKAYGYVDFEMGHMETGHIECCLGCGKPKNESVMVMIEPHIWTGNSCSVCGAKAVAEYEGMKYSSLRFAFAEACRQGSEITLLDDAVVDERLNIHASTTINGNGHTITFKCNVEGDDTSPAGAITIEGSSLTLNDVTVKAAEGYDVYSVICNLGDLNITGCTVTGNTTPEHAKLFKTTYGIYNNGNLIAADSNVSGGYTGGIGAHGGVVEVTGSLVEDGVELGMCTAKITDCNISSVLDYQSGLNFKGNVNAEIKNCNISADYGINGNNYYGENKFVIEGGTITAAFQGIYIMDMDDAEAVITGGCTIQRDTSVSYDNNTGISIGNTQSVSLEKCSITGFTKAINTYGSECPVSSYLPENYYCWDSDDNKISDTDVQTINGNVSIHPCTHGDAEFTYSDDTHSGTCTICGKNVTEELHIYDYNDVCTVCGFTAAAKVNNDGVISYTNKLSEAFKNPGATITLLKNVTLSEGITPSDTSFTLDLNGHTIDSNSYSISGEHVTLEVRSSKGGKIDCDINVTNFIANGNAKCGKVSADDIYIYNENVEIGQLEVCQGNQTNLECGKYGSIAVTGDNTTLGSILSPGEYPVYYAYYDAEGNLMDILGDKSVQNVTIKRCTHVCTYTSIDADIHKKTCKYCKCTNATEQHKFIVADTQMRGEKRTISGICECGAERIFTLDENTYTYDGNVKSPEVTGMITYGDNTWDLTKDENYWVDCNSVNAGLGKVMVSGRDNGTQFMYVLSFEIRKAEYGESDIRWERQILTYTGEQVDIAAPEVNIDIGDIGEITYSYAVVDSNEFTEGLPVNAGDYTLKAVVPETDNYNSKEVTITLTVEKAQGSLTIPTDPFEKNYGDDDFSLNCTKVGDGKISYSVGDENVIKVSEDGTATILKAGSTDITVTLENGANYFGANGSQTIKVTVNKAEKPSVLPENKMNAYLEHEKVGSIELPKNWEWNSEDKEKALEVGETVTATAQYVGEDKDCYKNIEVKIEITRSEVSQPSETEPSETEPSETEPSETEPSETQPSETEPSETEPSETEPSETEPSETDPSETEPSETQPSETEPSETEPSETEPSESEPSETEPSETQPIIPLPIIPQPIIPQPSDPQPSEPQPSDPQPSKPEAEKPYIEGDNGKSGWEVIREEAETAENNSEVTVEMNGATEVPVDVLKSVKDKDVTLTFDMSEGISWSINGADITEQVGNIDLGVTVGSNAIPEDVVNDVAGENYSVQLSLSHDGEFGFAATLSVDMGKEKAGYFASLFYYNEQNGKPEFITESKITEEGAAKLKFTHASEYIIVVNEKSRFDEEPSITESSSDNSGDNTPSSEAENVNTTDNGSDNSTSPTTDGESSGENNPNTGDNSAQTAIWFAAFGVLASVTGAFIFTRRRKKINR